MPGAVPNPVRVPIQIRWRDLDPLGHVNNAVFITYFESARLAYGRALLGPQAKIDPDTLLPEDLQFILAEVSCQYRSPVTLQDSPVIETWVSQIGRKSFVLQYRMTDERGGRLLAEGCSTQVWYDYQRGVSQLVPQRIINLAEALQKAPIDRS